MSDNEDEDYKSVDEEEEEDSIIGDEDEDEDEDEENKPRLLISSKEDKSLAEQVESDAEDVPDSDEEEENIVVNNDDEEDEPDEPDEPDEDENDDTEGDEPAIPAVKKSVKPSAFVDDKDDDEDEEDDDEEDDHYLQKFDVEVNKNYLLDFHPECTSHNYEEIAALSTVTRDKHNNIIDDLHKTVPYLTKYEKSRIIGQRAKQINSGAQTFVKVPENVIDGYLIAELELMQKRIPFIIRRPIFGGGSEYWCVKDLENIGF